MKKVLNTPIFYYPSHIFTGDNLSYFIPAKYLWHICNIKREKFHQPVYDFFLENEVKIDFIFYPEHPMHLYFKKPDWINNFIECKEIKNVKELSKNYDYFINNYRYRGARPVELNWGYSNDIKSLELYLVAYTYKAVFEHDLYIDDLELREKYSAFLNYIRLKISPQNKPIIVIHHRGQDPWKRQLPERMIKNEQLIFNLLDIYPDHIIVLTGENWKCFYQSRVKNLNEFINEKNIKIHLKEFTTSLQFILAGYFCRDVEVIFGGISGFTAFIETIRPKNLMPLIPIFWGEKTFTGIDTCIEAMDNWRCDEYETYRSNNLDDLAFFHYCQHYLYYAKDQTLLKPYCLDFPNDLDKIFKLLSKLEKKYINCNILENKLSIILKKCKTIGAIPNNPNFLKVLIYEIKHNGSKSGFKYFMQILKNNLKKTFVHKIYKLLKNFYKNIFNHEK
jgi:hypothetical protein